MKTLSNAELQDAIEHTVRLIRGDGSRSSVILTVHLEALTDEQQRRATDEITLEPIDLSVGNKICTSGHIARGDGGGNEYEVVACSLDRAELDARVARQNGQYMPFGEPL